MNLLLILGFFCCLLLTICDGFYLSLITDNNESICLVMTNKENFYFAGKCLTLDEHPEFSWEIIQTIESDSVNWEDFVRLCSNHLILPVMYLKFHAHELLSFLPNGLAEFLKEIYELNLSRNQQILNQLHEITKILNQNGIYPTLLKGAGNLVDQLYDNPGERIMGDIDLLVPQNDYLPAARLLEKDGYSYTAHFMTDIKHSKHYPRLSKPGVPASVEVHRLPVNQSYTKWYNTEIIDTEKKRIDNGVIYFVLSDKHKVVHNFIHAQLSNKGDAYGIVSFRDIYDLYLLSIRIPIVTDLIPVQYQRKAISYFVLAGNALGLPKRFYAHESFSSRIFCMKHDLNQSSVVFYKTYRKSRFLYEKIILGYSRQVIQSFYSKEMRQSVIGRLSNPRWYKNHLDSYLSFFTSSK